MLGNVSEWCGDAQERVIRGGSWRTPPWACRSASRNFADADGRTDYSRFRIAREL